MKQQSSEEFWLADEYELEELAEQIFISMLRWSQKTYSQTAIEAFAAAEAFSDYRASRYRNASTEA